MHGFVRAAARAAPRLGAALALAAASARGAPRLAAGPRAGEAEGGEAVLEHRTLQRYALTRGASQGGGELALVACSVRCMMQWCSLPMARAYAFALYVPASAVALLQRREAEAAPAAAAAAAAAPAADRLQALLDLKSTSPAAAGELLLSLRIARDIAGAHMARGFANSANNMLRRRSAPLAPAESAAVAAELAELGRAFERHADFKPGDEVTFSWRADGSVIVASKGAFLAEVRSAPLARALFDVYCGDKAPVSPPARAAFKANLDALVESRAAVTMQRVGSGAAVSLDAGVHRGIVLSEHAERKA